MTINHLNGVKHDNRVENLALATMHEQQVHAYALGLQKVQRGSARGRVAKLTEEDVAKIRYTYAKGGVTQMALAKLYNVSSGAIALIITRQRWTHI